MHHPAELAQRSHSLCVGPMTPATPFPATPFPPNQPLLVNTSQQPFVTSLPSTSGVTTPRSAQPPMLMSPVSRHNSISSTGRPASIQTMRHHSVMFPPDVSIPPPPISLVHDDPTVPKGTPPSRRSSETLAPLKSPPFGNHIQNLMTMPIVPPPHILAATGTHSVSSSAHSTPRHSISGTPIHYEPSTSKSNQPPTTPKSGRPDKVQVRHDSISKPGPSNSVSSLQARSQSMTSGDHKKSTPSTPVVRDAGSDLIAQIMSNQPSMGFKKLPRIEKKPSALQNVHNQPTHVHTVSTPSTPSTSSNQSMLLKDKEREKERRRKERELEREREARKEMKRKETKEERHKRKEMERAKREEDERRERKREKQRIKEKEERRKEKERERRKAEKEKEREKKKKKHRKDEDSDESDSTSNDELDLDVRKSAKEMTQEEKDHQLALILSKGSIIENLKSRRRSDRKGNDSFDKMRQKNQNAAGTRRVLIESSDDDGGDGDDDDKDSSSGEASESEQRFLAPPPMTSSTASSEVSKDHKHKLHKEREKGELTSSSEDEENREGNFQRHQRSNEDRENRKRQKSLTNYSSDEHGKNAVKRSRRDDSEDVISHNNSWAPKEEQKQRKRKLVHRLSSEDESRRKAKQRDFRDIPHEDVSDEEEMEDASARIRRQSSSSTTSNHGKREKSGKTPLRVVTPAGTPLHSPKILSPELLSPNILSPKSATSSIKRPSITDQAILISPKARNRTTSSTSTATNSSKHEVSTVPEKLISPPVTAKSSVSSIDDLTNRDEFNFNSAADSPMSATGRPMVLTKAAMKAFNSSPPKKQSSSSGPHDSSSASSSTSSSSDGSSSSTDDSSDDETLKPVEPVVTSKDVVEDTTNTVGQDDLVMVSSLSTAIPPPIEIPVLSSEEVAPEPDPMPVVDVPLASSPPATEPLEDMKEMTPPSNVLSAEEVEQEEKTVTSNETDESVLSVQHDEIQEEIQTPIELEPVNESVFDPEPQPEPERVSTPAASCFASPSQFEVNPKSLEAPPSAHTLISDQETDQAVQSIFDEEEDEIPQYPDFVMTNDEKEISEKEQAASVEPAPSTSTSSSDSCQADSLLSPKQSTSEKIADSSEYQEDGNDKSMNFPHHVNPTGQVIESMDSSKEPTPLRIVEDEEDEVQPMEQEVSRVVVDDDDDDSDGYGEHDLKIVESSPEQTPTPDLIPNEKVVSIEQPVRIEVLSKENHEQVQAPVQPTAPLEIIVSQYNSQHSQQQQQVIQPSPRPAVTPVSQQSSGQPVSVVQQSRLEQPSPIVVSAQSLDSNQIEELIKKGNITEVAAIMTSNPRATENLRPAVIDLLKQILVHAAHGDPSNLSSDVRQLQAGLMAQLPIQHANKNARRIEMTDRQSVEELARKQKEELDRRMDAERSEKKKKDRVTLADERAAQKIQNERLVMERLMNMMPNEAQQMYNGFAGISPIINRHQHGLNGTTQHHQLTRPSSTASTSSNSARTPLQSSTSVNLNQKTPSPKCTSEIQFQRWFYNHFPMVWTGRLTLKSTETMINLHLINGSETFLNGVLGRQLNEENPRRDSVKILQRLRLDNGQVEHIHGILTNPEYACCLALSSVTEYESLARNESNLKASFIDYLTKKQIAGISSLEEIETKFKSARVHVFAPGEIVNKYLSALSSRLFDYLQDTDTRYLLIVFTNDKTDPNMDGPPPTTSLAVPPLISNS